MPITLRQSAAPNLPNAPALGLAPAPGNLLLVQHASKVLQTGGGPGAGWADVFGDYVDIAPGNLGFGLYWRIAQVGDPASPLPGVFGAGDYWNAGEFAAVNPAGAPFGVGYIKQQGPPGVARYHFAIAPAGAGEVLVIGAGITGIGSVAAVTPDAGYGLVGAFDYAGAGKVAALVYLVDQTNDAAYDPGFTVAAAPNNWGAGSFAWPGASGPARAFHGGLGTSW